jgi:single-strand DNA-binding protein
MNQVSLVGRLVYDPELRQTPEGRSVCNFKIAVERGRRDAGADFVPIQAWGALAESVAEHLKKGRLVGVSGSLRSRRIEKEDRNFTIVNVFATNVQFLDRPKAEEAVEE